MLFRITVAALSVSILSIGSPLDSYALNEQGDGGDRRFTRIKFAVCPFRIHIHERLLVDSAHTFQVTNVKGVLRPKITG